jgi:hypothetical protein
VPASTYDAALGEAEELCRRPYVAAGVENLIRQHSKGRMTVRERIRGLTPPRLLAGGVLPQRPDELLHLLLSQRVELERRPHLGEQRADAEVLGAEGARLLRIEAVEHR